MAIQTGINRKKSEVFLSMTLSSTNEETIAAIATAIASGQGGIAVVRVSGPKAIQTAQKVVLTPGSQIWESHRLLYGHVLDANGKERIDEVLVLIMKAPRSFTGEDVIEIQCHGGLITVQRVLEQVLKQSGVRRALPGEFSQRAVLNGRIDLTQAEAISELIAARSQKAAQLAMAGLDGGIQNRITKLRDKLIDYLSEIEARVDFEDELPLLDGENLLQEILNVKLDLKALVEESNRQSYLRNGLKIVIIGRPNVGKSSLLNRLSHSEKAIVTDLPGTTRDILESEIILKGIPIMLLDTAGIRTTEDAIEKIGIARSNKALLTADIILVVFDISQGWQDEDQALLANIPEKIPKLFIGNKADLKNYKANDSFLTRVNHISPKVVFSALTGKGEADLIDALLDICGASTTNDIVAALNERQRDLATLAAAALENMKEVADQELPWDFWTIDLRQAIHHLGEITGAEITEAVLDKIFSRFCIGK